MLVPRGPQDGKQNDSWVLWGIISWLLPVTVFLALKWLTEQ